MRADQARIAVHLHDQQTGRRGVYETDGWFPDGAFQDFIWSEGNYSCDHNRVLFLYGWHAPESDDEEHFNCVSQRIVFEKIVRLDNGQTVYEETEAP